MTAFPDPKICAERARVLQRVDPAASAWWHYSSGYAWFQMGSLGNALSQFRAAQRGGEPLGAAGVLSIAWGTPGGDQWVPEAWILPAWRKVQTALSSGQLQILDWLIGGYAQGWSGLLAQMPIADFLAPLKAWHLAHIDDELPPRPLPLGLHQSCAQALAAENLAGAVYFMANPAHAPGILKIGRTTDIVKRRQDLSSATGVYVPFVVRLYGEFTDCHFAERQAHQHFAPFNVGKEFFQVDEPAVIEWAKHHKQWEDQFYGEFQRENAA